MGKINNTFMVECPRRRVRSCEFWLRKKKGGAGAAHADVLERPFQAERTARTRGT